MVLETLVLVRDIATYFFVWSYKTGKFIVSVLCLIARSLYVSAEKLSYLLRILVGDFELFVQDVSRTTNNIVNLMGEIYNDYSRIVEQVIKFFTEYLFLIACGIRDFFTNIYFAVEETVIFVNNFVKLIGPAVWFLVTLPNAIFQLVVHCIYDIKTNLHELYAKTLKFVQELHISSIRVPTESCAGLIIILIFVCSAIRFRKFISNICRKLILFLCSCFNLNIIKYPLNSLRLMLVKSNPAHHEYRQSGDESHLCIICQTNSRSIVLLPCRHLCLCDKCSNELAKYRTKNCPVCRQETNLKLRVYL